MWAAAHAVCGAAVGRWIRRPVPLAATAAASHIVLDWIPHWDYPADASWAAVDVAAAVVLVALLCRPDRLMWWGAFWAAIPDLDVVLRYYAITSVNLFPSHQDWFPHGGAAMLPGSLLQIGFIIACILLARHRNAGAAGQNSPSPRPTERRLGRS